MAPLTERERILILMIKGYRMATQIPWSYTTWLFLWGYLKDKVYQTKPANLAELQQRIRNEITAIDANTIRQVVQAFYNSIAYCQTAGGENFEHLVK